MRRLANRLLIGSAAVGTLTTFSISDAAAQAFTPAEQSLNMDASYTFAKSNQIEGVTDADTTSHILRLGLDYGLPFGLALELGLPLISTSSSENRWHGLDAADDTPGKETAFTDVSGSIRRGFPLGAFTLTPGIGITIPTNDYQNQGNAAVGTGLMEGHLGLDAAWVAPMVEGLFVMGGIEYTDGEKFKEAEFFKDFSRARIDANIVAGYQISEKLVAYGLGIYRKNFDGFEFKDFADYLAMESNVPREEQQTRNLHEPVLKEQYLYVGAGATYQLAQDWSVNAAVLTTVINDNSHNPLSIQLGFGYSFSFAEEEDWDEEFEEDVDDSAESSS